MSTRTVKLGELERTILVAAHLRAGESARTIARSIKLQERTVRYHLHRMEQRGIIRRVPFINVYPLGLRYFNIYFSFSTTEYAKRQKIVRELKDSSRVTWLGELGGEFNLGFALLVTTPEECLEFIEELCAKAGELFLHKEIIAHRSLTVFSARYLAPNVKASDSFGDGALGYGALEYGADSKDTAPVKLDSLDKALIKQLSSRGSMSIRALAQSVGIPHSTIALRMRRLTEMKVLAGEWYAVDVKRLGYQTLKLLVEVRGITRELRRDLRRYVERRPEFVYLIECFGKWDFEIGCDVPTDGGVSSIIDDFTDRFCSTVLSIKIVPMFKVLKWNLYP